jgi:hypothetical protein
MGRVYLRVVPVGKVMGWSLNNIGGPDRNLKINFYFQNIWGLN